MIFRRLRRILAAENADYTSIAYFPALFKSEFRRKSESDHRYTKKAAQSENRTAFLKNLWCGRQDLNLPVSPRPQEIFSGSTAQALHSTVFSIPRFSGFVKHVHQFFPKRHPQDRQANQTSGQKASEITCISPCLLQLQPPDKQALSLPFQRRLS